MNALLGYYIGEGMASISGYLPYTYMLYTATASVCLLYRGNIYSKTLSLSLSLSLSLEREREREREIYHTE